MNQMTIHDNCPKCQQPAYGVGSNYFKCGSFVPNQDTNHPDGLEESIGCIRNQRDQIKAALANLMPFVTEFERSPIHPKIAAAIEEAKRLTAL